MRTSYLITYDICEDKRLRKVFNTIRGYGDHLQYSVFECQLTPSDLVRLRAVRWTPFVGQFFGRSYLGQASLRRRREAAIHSGLESALGSHPCVALSSYQAPRL